MSSATGRSQQGCCHPKGLGTREWDTGPEGTTTSISFHLHHTQTSPVLRTRGTRGDAPTDLDTQRSTPRSTQDTDTHRHIDAHGGIHTPNTQMHTRHRHISSHRYAHRCGHTERHSHTDPRGTSTRRETWRRSGREPDVFLPVSHPPAPT